MSLLKNKGFKASKTRFFGPRLTRPNGLKFRTHYQQQYREFHSTKATNLDDPYKTLGVDKSANASQIKKAYYKLAKKFHPDVNQEKGAEEKFHSLQEAYDILSDPAKKQQYDQFGAAAFNQGAGGGPGGNPYGGNPFGGSPFGGNPFGGFGGAHQGNPFEGINFEDLFGGGFSNGFNNAGKRRGGVQHFQGEDIEILKTISFKDAIFGTKIQVNYSAISECGTCHGDGLKTGKKKSTCRSCNGTGSQTHVLQGGFHMSSTCNVCNGTGVEIKPEDQCTSCHGEGVRAQMKQTEVRLPAGIKDGSRLRVANAGDAPNMTKSSSYKLHNGDLIIRIRVQPDPVFKRDGMNLICKVEIPMTTAALGGIVEIPTINGPKIKLRVTAGSQSGKVVEIPDQGVPRNDTPNADRGSLKVILEVKTLKPMNATQIALLEAVADAFGDNTAKRLDPNWKPLEGVYKESQDGESAACEHPNNLKRIESFLSSTFKKIMGDKKSDEKKD